MAEDTEYWMRRARQDLGLTEQEQALYRHHLNNLYGSGKVNQPNGDVSTLLQAVVQGPDDKYYNIPTVWEGKALPVDDAIKRVKEVGWDAWPSYETLVGAESRYDALHDYLSRDTGVWRNLRRPAGH